MKDRRTQLHILSGGHEADERHIWYALRGPDLDPEAISALTGIRPDRAHRRGEARPRTGEPYPDVALKSPASMAWMIDSGLPRSAEVHDHLEALIARLAPARPAFIALGVRYEATVVGAVTLAEAQGPLVAITPAVAASLAELNALLAFDLYAATLDPSRSARRPGRPERSSSEGRGARVTSA